MADRVSIAVMKKELLTLRWIGFTLAAILGVAVMIRLGFWQLDRLAQTRALNAKVSAQINAPPLDLNQSLPVDQLNGMEYRSVVVVGVYDSSQEVILRNQVNDGQPGYVVITPLKIQGSDYSILVERGWIPLDQATPALRAQYAEPGVVTVKGIIRLSQTQPTFLGAVDPTLAPGQTRLDAWSMVNVGRIQQQVNLKLLPVYVQEAPDPFWTGLPYRSVTLPDLSDGPHLSYAIQWFLFATILGIGYPFLVRRSLKKKTLS